jgi:hypothetical protein
MHGIYTYIPETNNAPKQYNIAAILSLLFMVSISLAAALALMQGSSTRGPRATCGPRSPLPWPAGRFEKITTNPSPASCLHIKNGLWSD